MAMADAGMPIRTTPLMTGAAANSDDGAVGPSTRVDPEVLRGRSEASLYYYTLAGTSAVAHRCATGITTR
jgi:hypothetical protein